MSAKVLDDAGSRELDPRPGANRDGRKRTIKVRMEGPGIQRVTVVVLNRLLAEPSSAEPSAVELLGK